MKINVFPSNNISALENILLLTKFVHVFPPNISLPNPSPSFSLSKQEVFYPLCTSPVFPFFLSLSKHIITESKGSTI